MLMFGGRNNWLHEEISKISTTLTQVVAKLSALESDVQNITSSQNDHKGRIDSIDGRVKKLELSKSADDNEWSGAKTVWVVIAGVLGVLTTVAAIITVIVLLV